MILVLLDLSAAFDSIDHDILIDKLHMIGVRGDALCWVESYLSARTQVIRIGEATSQPIHLHSKNRLVETTNTLVDMCLTKLLVKNNQS